MAVSMAMAPRTRQQATHDARRRTATLGMVLPPSMGYMDTHVDTQVDAHAPHRMSIRMSTCTCTFDTHSNTHGCTLFFLQARTTCRSSVMARRSSRLEPPAPQTVPATGLSSGILAQNHDVSIGRYWLRSNIVIADCATGDPRRLRQVRRDVVVLAVPMEGNDASTARAAGKSTGSGRSTTLGAARLFAVALLCSSVPLLLCSWRLRFAFVFVVRLGAGAAVTVRPDRQRLQRRWLVKLRRPRRRLAARWAHRLFLATF